MRALKDRADATYLLEIEDSTCPAISQVYIRRCTLWTDFNLNGDQQLAMMRAAGAMNDYNLIQEEDGRFKPRHALQRHQVSVDLLRLRLSRPRRLPVVVMTHHLPSARSIAGRYAGNEYNAAYASNLDDLVESSGAALWVHGHTHVSQDYRIGETRVVCNPRGYDGYELNPDFDPDLIIEVGQ